MKYISLLIAFAFLASCGAKVAETVTPSDATPQDAAEKQTIDDIDSELIDMIEESAENTEDVVEESVQNEEEQDVESKVVVLEAPYVNPAGDVDMKITYTLDENNAIESIDVAATTYDLTDFNTSAQKVIGMTIEDAANESITGGSLTDPAFSAALKKVQ